MQHHAEILLEDTVDETQALNIIQEQIKENPLLIYMKGNASLPQCGFSAQVVEIFNNLGAKYKTFNILLTTSASGMFCIIFSFMISGVIESFLYFLILIL